MTTARHALCGVLVAMLGVAAGESAQPLDPAKWTLELRRASSADSDFTVHAVVGIEKGWRLYSLTQPAGGPLATRIWLDEREPWTLAGPIQGPEPLREFDRVFGMDVETHVRSAEFDIPVRRRKDSAGGPIRVKVRYQMCNAELCLRPRTLSLELPIEGGGRPRP